MFYRTYPLYGPDYISELKAIPTPILKKWIAEMDTEKDEFILNTRAVISGEIEIHGIEETSVKFNISKWVLEQFYEPKAPTKRPMEAV